MYDELCLACSGETVPDSIFQVIPSQNDLANIRYDKFDWKNEKPIWLKQLSDPKKSCLKQRQQILTALVQDDTNSEACRIAERILYCRSSRLQYKSCGHPLCPYCRHVVQEHRQFAAAQLFGQTPITQLAFLTVLLPVVYAPTAATIKNEMDKARKAISYRLASYAQKKVRLLGAFEIDVKRPELITASRTCDILENLGMDFRSKQPAFLPHLHAIVDLGTVSKSALRVQLTRTFRCKYQVSLKSFQVNKSKADSISDLASYIYKFRVQYASGLYQGTKTVRPRDKYKKLYCRDDIIKVAEILETIRVNTKMKGLHYSFNT